MRSALARNTGLIAKASFKQPESRRRIGKSIITCSLSHGNSAGSARGLPSLINRLIHRSGFPKGNTRSSGRGGGGIGAGGGSGAAGGSAVGDSSGGPSRGGLWGAYMRCLESSPILTKSITASVLNAIGDILSQVYFEKNEKLDFTRIFQFSLLGLIFVGPSLHFWYGALATKVTVPGKPGLFLRLFVDQGLFAPVFIATFFSLLLTLEGKPNLIENKLKLDLKSAVYANWQLWVPIQLINFAFVPVNLQVLFANTIAIGWNTYMSYKSHKYVPPVVLED